MCPSTQSWTAPKYLCHTKYKCRLCYFHIESKLFEFVLITDHLDCYRHLKSLYISTVVKAEEKWIIPTAPVLLWSCRVDHDDVIKWKHIPRNWPFVWGIHRSPVNSPHKGQWRGALMFSVVCVWIYDWVNNREAGDLRRYRVHCDVIVMCIIDFDPRLSVIWVYSHRKIHF